MQRLNPQEEKDLEDLSLKVLDFLDDIRPNPHIAIAALSIVILGLKEKYGVQCEVIAMPEDGEVH